MRIVDVLLSIPFLFVILIVAVRYGATVLGLSVIIGIFTWQVPARLVRGEVLTLRVRDFVAAARAAGSGRLRLINRHLLPNSLGVIVVTATFAVADAILAVARSASSASACSTLPSTGATCSTTGSSICRTDTGGRSTPSGSASSWW